MKSIGTLGIIAIRRRESLQPARRRGGTATHHRFGGRGLAAGAAECLVHAVRAEMGIKFNEEETSDGMARVQAMVQAHNVTDDVVTVDTAQVLAACDSGVLFGSTGARSHHATASCPAPRAIVAWASMSMATFLPTTPT